MRNLKMTLLALAAPMGACVTRGGEEPTPIAPAGYNFAYLAPQGEAIGLVQAFDDGAHTYLELDGRSSQLSIRADAGSPPLPFAAGERYITVDGVYARLVLSNEQASATLVNEIADSGKVVDAARPAPRIDADRIADARSPSGLAAVGVPESEQTMTATLRVSELNQEIRVLDERIHSLCEQITELQALASGGLSVRSELQVPRIVVRFDDNSDEARIEATLLASLGAAARAANRIYLHGHTDAFVASSQGTDLAIRRAVSVRQLLVAQAVNPARIRLFYRGAGNFLANNSMAAGKAQNRRVEIELRKW